MVAERDAKIIQWAQSNPCSTLKEIGDHYGISRQRVEQILKASGVVKLSAYTARPVLLCPFCDLPLARGTKRHAKCGIRVELTCSECARAFTRVPSRILRYDGTHGNLGTYCSHACRNKASVKWFARPGVQREIRVTLTCRACSGRFECTATQAAIRLKLKHGPFCSHACRNSRAAAWLERARGVRATKVQA